MQAEHGEQSPESEDLLPEIDAEKLSEYFVLRPLTRIDLRCSILSFPYAADLNRTANDLSLNVSRQGFTARRFLAWQLDMR